MSVARRRTGNEEVLLRSFRQKALSKTGLSRSRVSVCVTSSVGLGFAWVLREWQGGAALHADSGDLSGDSGGRALRRVPILASTQTGPAVEDG